MKAKLRAQIKKRDDHRCRYCGKSDEFVKLTIDHIIPTSRGGHPEKKQNLVTCCFNCNQKKANKTPEEAGMVILSEGFDYLPLGKLRDELGDITGGVTVNHGRKKRRKSKRRERKALVKAIVRDGVEAHLCPCGTGFHTLHFHENHMKGTPTCQVITNQPDRSASTKDHTSPQVCPRTCSVKNNGMTRTND